MEHGARLSTTRVIALGYICLGTVLTLSLTTNIIQGINNYRLQTEQKVAVTPMLFSAPFAVSQNQTDASYLEQLGLSFIALRLNVTPETVDAQHQQLLRYVLPASQNSLKVQLAEDAKRIKENNVNATFYMTSVRAYPAESRVDVRGAENLDWRLEALQRNQKLCHSVQSCRWCQLAGAFWRNK